MQPEAPASFRLFRRSPVPPALTGGLIAIASVALLAGLEWVSGRPGRLLAGHAQEDVGCAWLVGDYRIALLGVLLLVYVATARYILAEVTVRHARALGAGEGFRDADRLASSRPWGVIPGLVGMVIVFLAAVDIAERPVEWTRAYWILPHLFNWAWCVPFGWMGGRFLFAVVANGVLMGRLARATSLAGAFDASTLKPAVLQSNASALLLMLFLGFLSIHFIDPGAGYITTLLLFTSLLVAFVCAGIGTFSAAASMRAQRQQELVQVREQIAELQSATLSGGAVSTDRLQNLLLLESRLQEGGLKLAEGRTLLRGLFYATLGLLSWLGAAAVERVLDYFLG